MSSRPNLHKLLRRVAAQAKAFERRERVFLTARAALLRRGEKLYDGMQRSLLPPPAE